MADSFERRIRILEMLKCKEDGTVTIPEIITRLSSMGIDVTQNKTVERDMTYLSTIMNIGCDDSIRPFQWWWEGKDSIDIPGMGRNSALTFKLTQQYLEPLLPARSLKYLQPKFKQSKKVLAGRGKEKDRHWINKIRVVPKVMDQIPAKIAVRVQDAVYEALYEEKMLQITYLSRNSDITTRRIHPLALIYRGITTELIFCGEDSDKAQRFILNRIQKAKIQIQSLKIPDNFNLDDFIKNELGFPGSCQEIIFRAWISYSARQNVEETPLCKNQTIEEADNGAIIITANIRETADLVTWILGLGARIKVLEPDTLKDKIAGIVQGMAKHYPAP